MSKYLKPYVIPNSMKYILLSLLVLSVIIPSVSAYNFTPIIYFDINNGTYSQYIFANMSATGNLTTPSALAYGAAKPFMDYFTKLTGDTSSGYWVFCIVWLCYLGAIYIATGKVVIPLLIGIMTASAVALLIPSLVIPIVTVLFAVSAAAVFYRLVVDR